MHARAPRFILAIATLMVAPHALASFSFSEEEAKAKAENEPQKRTGAVISTSCRKSLINRKVMVVIGQRSSHGTDATQGSYSPHFQAINKRLQKFGFNTYTQEEITKQIAQAELDAYFRNDPDSAINASKKMGADFILRGVISSRTATNPVLRIPEVYVNMGFTLTAANGKTISDTAAKAESYSGTDTLSMALTLVNEQADSVVAHLANDYCRHAAVKNKSK